MGPKNKPKYNENRKYYAPPPRPPSSGFIQASSFFFRVAGIHTAYLAHVEQLDVRGVPLELVLEETFVEVQVPVVEPESPGLVDLVREGFRDGFDLFCFGSVRSETYKVQA